MPSWDDGESSSSDILGDLTDLDYAPAYVEDPNFSGIAPDCALVCRNHKMAPQQCVAFEGSNTGRRFYLCPVENVSSIPNYNSFSCFAHCLVLVDLRSCFAHCLVHLPRGFAQCLVANFNRFYLS